MVCFHPLYHSLNLHIDIFGMITPQGELILEEGEESKFLGEMRPGDELSLNSWFLIEEDLVTVTTFKIEIQSKISFLTSTWDVLNLPCTLIQ